MNISILQEYFADLKDGWPLIGGVVAVAFIISMGFTVFISFCAGCFVWSIILLFWVFMALLGTSAFLVNKNQFIQKILHYNDLPENLKDRDYQLACAYICWSICLISFLIICCTLKKIRICTALSYS